MLFNVPFACFTFALFRICLISHSLKLFCLCMLSTQNFSHFANLYISRNLGAKLFNVPFVFILPLLKKYPPAEFARRGDFNLSPISDLVVAISGQAEIWVDAVVVDPKLEMQVVARCRAGHSDISDKVALFNIVALFARKL